jgi:hypothetical protein
VIPTRDIARAQSWDTRPGRRRRRSALVLADQKTLDPQIAKQTLTAVAA